MPVTAPSQAPRRTIERFLGGFMGVLLTLSIARFLQNNLANQFFWTDEATTLITAIGRPSLGELNGPIQEMWFGVAAFLDPGSFHLLARYWIFLFGSEIQALRFLPFLFFLLYLVGIFLLFRLIKAPLYLALAGCGLMCLENITPYYALEFRPYSAGLAAAVLIPASGLALIQKRLWSRLFLFAFIVTTLGSMQYSTLSIACATAAVLLLACIKCATRKDRIVLASGAILATSWLPTYFLITRGNPFSVGGGTGLSYISDTVMSNMPIDQLTTTVASNLLSLTALPRTIFLLAFPIFWWRQARAHNYSSPDPIMVITKALWQIVSLALVFTVLLAWLGFVPWILGSRWSIAEVSMIALSVVGIAGIWLMSGFSQSNFFSSILLAICLVVITVSSLRLMTYQRPNNVSYLASLGSTMLSGQPHKLMVDSWLFLDTRYWIEFSGQHDDLRAAWVRHSPRPTPGTRASADDVRDFIFSDNDRILLRGETVLDQYAGELPSSIEIVRVPSTEVTGPLTSELPILLIKN